MYDELIKRLRDCTAEQNGEKTLWCQAADAIEELRMKLRGDEATIVGMKREIERMVVSNASNTLNNDAMRWISVTERLPEGKTNVLCCGANGGMFVGWTGGYVFEGKVRAFVHGGSGRNITHWMPLPEPPKEEK